MRVFFAEVLVQHLQQKLHEERLVTVAPSGAHEELRGPATLLRRLREAVLHELLVEQAHAYAHGRAAVFMPFVRKGFAIFCS